MADQYMVTRHTANGVTHGRTCEASGADSVATPSNVSFVLVVGVLSASTSAASKSASAMALSGCSTAEA